MDDVRLQDPVDESSHGTDQDLAPLPESDYPTPDRPTPDCSTSDHPAPEASEDVEGAADHGADAPTSDSTPSGPTLVPEPLDASRDSGADDADAPQPTRDLGPVVEALLFGADGPLSAGKLAELAGAGTPTVIRDTIQQLNERYDNAGMTFRIETISGGFRLMTLGEFQPWLSKLNKSAKRTRLTNAALETLAIVAYKQPLIRAEIEAIRGVACGEAINRLREMGLVKIVGRAEVVGRPMLYGTTRKFLDVFGLSKLDDLPALDAVVLRRAPETESGGETDQQQAASA